LAFHWSTAIWAPCRFNVPTFPFGPVIVSRKPIFSGSPVNVGSPVAVSLDAADDEAAGSLLDAELGSLDDDWLDGSLDALDC
jgi:hypothetical protein